MNQFFVLCYKRVITLIVCLHLIGAVMCYNIDRNVYEAEKTNDKLQKYQGLPFEEKIFRIIQNNLSITPTPSAFEYMMEDNEIEDESPKPQVYYNAHQYGPYLHNEQDERIIIKRK